MKSKKVLFSANDPGGANAILPVVKALIARGDSVRGIVTGPATDIFARAGISADDAGEYSATELAREITAFKPDVYLAGTSIGNSIDKRILEQLKGTPSVYVIDFWSRYGHRFPEAEADYTHLPTQICVTDERMRDEMVREGFPPEQLAITGNPHFEHFTEGITRDAEDARLAVFISQPIRKDVQAEGTLDCGFDEYKVLETVIAFLPAGMRLSIRLHPREERDKFDAYLNGRVAIAGEATLEEALSNAGLVIGMFSPVLMQSALAGKPTISYQPERTGEDPLPTNAPGITQAPKNEKELAGLLAAYAQGIFPRSKHGVEILWPKGATLRVVAVIDQLTQ